MKPSKVFTVTEALRDVKSAVEGIYPDLWIEGEISNLNCHSSGHCYFTLKDATAQLGVAIFRDDFSRVKFRPQNGLKVLVRGRLTIYPPQGKFQMVGTAMEPQGKGGLQLAFEQLKAKLEREGLFAAERKRAIPSLPKWIGIVTSSDGAALHDMLTVLGRRGANIRILVHPAKVQGEGAGRDVAAAITRLNAQFPELEAILVGRGGGSIEDLWAFNEEVVARAIVASAIPVISCVGHETDFTIADFVADLRAATPSAAAELVSRARVEVLSHIHHLISRLSGTMGGRLEGLEERVSRAMTSRMLQRPLALVEDYMDDLIRLRARLTAQTEGRLEELQDRLRRALSSRMMQRPIALIDDRLQDVDLLRDRLLQVIANRRGHWEKDFSHLTQKLQLLSPLATLSRGYAIVRKGKGGKVIRSAASVKPKEEIEVQLHEGKLYALIQRTEF